MEEIKMVEVSLINVGRDNHCETFKTNIIDLGTKILDRAANHLMSSDCELAEAKESTEELGVFNINAGFHTVGKATIKFVK